MIDPAAEENMNPLLAPRPLDGRLPDPTMGRGWVGKHSRPDRMAARWQALTSRMLAGMDRYTQANETFDKVPATLQEQWDLESQKDQATLEKEAAVFGPDRVVKRRQNLLKTMMENFGPNGMDMNAP